jgi:hypothetical protein
MRLSLGFPTGLDEHGPHSVNFLTVLKGSILICDFMNPIIFSLLIKVSNSAFVYIIHVTSLSCVGPYNFLRTLLSKINRRFCYVTDMIHVSQPYVTVSFTYNRFVYL